MRILIAFILILLVSPCYAQVVGQGLLMQGVRIGSATNTYTDVLFYWGAESDTAEKSGGDTSATRNSGAVIDNVLFQVGAGSLDCPTALDNATFAYSAGVINLTEGRVGFYFYADTLDTAASIFRVRYDSSNQIVLSIGTTDNTKLTLKYFIAGAGVDISTATGTLTTTTWYFIEIAWKESTDYREIFVNGVSKVSSTGAVGSPWAGDPTVIEFGELLNQASDFHLDQMIISNSSTRDLYALRDLTSF